MGIVQHYTNKRFRCVSNLVRSVSLGSQKPGKFRRKQKKRKIPRLENEDSNPVFDIWVIIQVFTCAIWVGRDVELETTSTMSDEQISSSCRLLLLPTITTYGLHYERVALELPYGQSIIHQGRTRIDCFNPTSLISSGSYL